MVNPTTLRPAWLPGLPESPDTVVGPYPGRLDALHERAAPGSLVASRGGLVLASPARLPAAPPGPLSRFGLATAHNHPVAPDHPAAETFAIGLLELHHDLLRQALRHALDHLDARTSGGTTLLNKQLVQGQLADAARDLAEDEAMPADRRHGDPAARWRTHERLITTGHHLLMLLGASGFLARPPVTELYLAVVTGNVYLHPGADRGYARQSSTDD